MVAFFCRFFGGALTVSAELVAGRMAGRAAERGCESAGGSQVIVTVDRVLFLISTEARPSFSTVCRVCT